MTELLSRGGRAGNSNREDPLGGRDISRRRRLRVHGGRASVNPAAASGCPTEMFSVSSTLSMQAGLPHSSAVACRDCCEGPIYIPSMPSTKRHGTAVG